MEQRTHRQSHTETWMWDHYSGRPIQKHIQYKSMSPILINILLLEHFVLIMRINLTAVCLYVASGLQYSLLWGWGLFCSVALTLILTFVFGRLWLSFLHGSQEFGFTSGGTGRTVRQRSEIKMFWSIKTYKSSMTLAESLMRRPLCTV